MADFGLLQTPNYAQAALSGWQAGAALGRQRQLDAALGAIDLERPETLLPVLRADPATGAALIGSSVKLASESRAMKAQAALGRAIGGAPPVAEPSATPSMAPASEDGAIIVTAPRATPNLQQRVAALVEGGASLEDANRFVTLVGNMDENERKARADSQEAIGRAYLTVAGLPEDQRAAKVRELAPELVRHGVTPKALANLKLDDASLEAGYTQALTVKEALDVRERATDNARQDRRIDLSERQAAESNRRADARLEKALSSSGGRGGSGGGSGGYEYRIGPDGKLQRRKR